MASWVEQKGATMRCQDCGIKIEKTARSRNNEMLMD